MRQLAKIITIALIISACGHDSGGSGSVDAPKSNTANSPSQTTKPTVAQGANEALYVAQISDLGPCTQDNLHQLVYVEEDKEFHTCQTQGWIIVNIDGKDGADGKDGVAFTNAWHDGVKNRDWYLGQGNVSMGACPSGTNHPTAGDFQEAITNGIDNFLVGQPVIWEAPVVIQLQGGGHTTHQMAWTTATGSIDVITNPLPAGTVGYNLCYKDPS